MRRHPMRNTHNHTVRISRTAVIAVLALCISTGLGAEDISIHGLMRSYTAGRFSESDIAVSRQTADITLEGWGEMTRTIINPYLTVDIGQEPVIGLREAYIDLFLETVDIRAGLQAVTWGQAEGAFITDIVSPRDMRSFILADFREIRKGIPAVKADWYAGPITLEAIWIPQFVPSTLPEAGSLWAREPALVPGVNIDIRQAELPSPTLENSEAFAQLRYFGSLISLEIMGGTAWTDEPYAASIIPGEEVPTVTQEYGRFGIAGGSFSTAVGPVAVRGETAVYLDKPFSLIDLSGVLPSVSVERHHQVQSLLGADWNLMGIDMSAQYLLSYIGAYRPGLIDQGKPAQEFSHTFTARLQDTYLNDRLTARLFIYTEADPLNSLIRPSLTWNVEDGVMLEAGAELFYGDEQGTFGAYSENSLIYAALRWYF
jgi:hypothetical protein